MLGKIAGLVTGSGTSFGQQVGHIAIENIGKFGQTHYRTQLINSRLHHCNVLMNSRQNSVEIGLPLIVKGSSFAVFQGEQAALY